MIGSLRRHHLLSQAFSLTEIMAVSAIITSIPAAQYARVKQKAVETECRSNLRQIGQMIMMFQISENHYPEAVFYPSKPFEDPKSIAVVLERAGYNIPAEMWICPAAPQELRERGMTFLYNETCGGRTTLARPNKMWLMIEMNCVSKHVPAPHPGGYNVLRADGSVITTTHLPHDLAKLQQAALPAEATPGILGRMALCFGAKAQTARVRSAISPRPAAVQP